MDDSFDRLISAETNQLLYLINGLVPIGCRRATLRPKSIKNTQRFRDLIQGIRLASLQRIFALSEGRRWKPGALMTLRPSGLHSLIRLRLGTACLALFVRLACATG